MNWQPFRNEKNHILFKDSDNNVYKKNLKGNYIIIGEYDPSTQKYEEHPKISNKNINVRPKKPSNGFMLFRNEQLKNVSPIYGNSHKYVVNTWNKMTEYEKAPYHIKAGKAFIEFNTIDLTEQEENNLAFPTKVSRNDYDGCGKKKRGITEEEEEKEERMLLRTPEEDIEMVGKNSKRRKICSSPKNESANHNYGGIGLER